MEMLTLDLSNFTYTLTTQDNLQADGTDGNENDSKYKSLNFSSLSSVAQDRSESGCNKNSKIRKQRKNYSRRAFLKGKLG
jgi:hypothetical protein